MSPIDAAESSARRTTVISAPGKVLIAGGYLVLEPAYPGLVLATTARFYSVVQDAGLQSSSSTSQPHQTSIRVHSPQFQGAFWEYNVHMDGERCTLRQTKETYDNTSSGRNPFVALALLYSLRLACEARDPGEVLRSIDSKGADIYVVADNDFYSQRTGDTTPTASDLRALPPFKAQKCTIKDVHKTGLGSSAAMTTSLVGSLLVHLGVVHINEDTQRFGDEELALIHNTAQLAHCAAQGKVGSGFDVSAAIWGSQLYRRFDKDAIQAVLDAGESVGVEGSDHQGQNSGHVKDLSTYLDPRNPLWRPSPLSHAEAGQTNPTATEGLAASASASDDVLHSIARPAPLELPPHVELALADVDAGSNTPSMVGKISAWRKSKPEWAQQMWTILSTANQTLADALLALRLAHAQDSTAYEAAIVLASQHFSKDWDALLKAKPSSALALLIEVRNALRSIQGGMRELGRQADVPVQPDEMGNVIKATVDGAKGVLGGGVPGAGGYDALFVLYIKTTFSGKGSESAADTPIDTIQQIQGVWSHWKALSVGPLLSEAGGAAGVLTSAAQAQGALLQQGAPLGLQVSLPAPSPNKIEQGGLRLHRIGDVEGLQAAVSASA